MSWSKRQRLRGAAAALALVSALALAACGGDDGSTEAETQPVATTPDAGPDKGKGPAGPQSAEEPDRPAPDDAIEDRPGGPGEATTPGTRVPTPSDSRRIERAVGRYVAALNADDGAALCSLLAPGALRGVRLPVRRGSCAATLTASIGQPPPDRAPRWLGTTIVDADSVVLVRGGDGRLTGTVVHRFAGSREPSIEEDVVYLRRVGGDWKLAKPSATFYRAIGARDVPLKALTPPRPAPPPA